MPPETNENKTAAPTNTGGISPELATILVAEDDAFLARVLSDKLIKEGYQVVRANDGTEVIPKAEAEHCNLIILDIIMPKKNGFDILDELKNHPTLKSIPVMVLSNLGQESDIRRAQEKGIVNYFVKSDISLASVVEKVRACLSQSPAK